MTTIGILGVGHLMRHMTPGLLRADPPPKLLLSPRGAETSGDLSRRYGLEIAPDNATLVERSGIVLLAVRPFQLVEATAGLPWREDHLVISLIAGISIKTVQAALPKCKVARAIPIVAAEYGQSPTCLHPDDPVARRLLEPAGPVIAFADEPSFEVGSIISCYGGWLQALMDETAAWMLRQNIDPETARLLVAGMTQAAATVVLERRNVPIEHLVKELCVPGSFTGQGLDLLRQRNAFAPWQEALQALLERMHRQRGT